MDPSIELDKTLIKRNTCNLNLKYRRKDSNGTIYIWVSPNKNKYLMKFTIESNETRNEYLCNTTIYNKLHNYLPNHVNQPIMKFKCNSENMKFLTQYHNTEFTVYVYYIGKEIRKNVKSCILADCKLNKKERCETVLQLLMYFIYLHKYTKIVHSDVTLHNIILKPNTDNISLIYNLNDVVFQFKPKYFAYPVNFSWCEESEDETDFYQLWNNVIINIFPTLQDPISDLKTNKQFVLNQITNGVFKKLVKIGNVSSTCTIS
jgi:hypothetical protein